MRPRLLSLLQHRDRDVAEALRRLGVVLEELPEPDRAGEPGRACADDEDTHLDRIGVARDAERVLDAPRGREPRRDGAHQALLARINSVSLGTIWWRSPTTPRSENSKIGAFGSLLIATITFELCMPTLCWIAPEIPQAT